MNQTRIATLLALTLLVSVGIVVGAPVARAFPPLPQGPSATGDGPVVVRLYFRDRDHLGAVAGELDIWEVHPDAEERYVVAAVTPAQYQWLESLGYRLEIDAEKTARLGITALLDPRFYYYDDFQPNANGRYVVSFLQDTNAAYPDLTELYDIGDAWMAGQLGEYDRDIWVLRITNEDPAYGDVVDKPAFFLFATIHAREVATPELAIRYIKYLTVGYDDEGGYGQDPDVTWLVDHNVAYVLVMQNPDGHWKNEQDTVNDRRKNMDWDDGCSSSYSWGVDLNRNHSFLWGCCGGSSGDPCSITYRGPVRGAEPETQAFENYFGTVMRDQNGPNGDDQIPAAAPITTTGIFISLHSHSDLVLWPWGFDDYGDPPNYDELETIGRKFAYYNGYDPSATIWYDVDGATDDWTYGKFGVPSFTFEVGPGGGPCGGFFPAYGCIDGIDGMPRNFWAENKPTFLYAHKIARTPYMTAYGPDAQNLSAAPSEVIQGAPVRLTATIADHRYGGDTLQPIAAAEYFVDAPPAEGEDGTGFPMAPTGEGWGDLSVEVTATVDTSGLEPGLHYLLVHGQNTNGDWGPLTAVFLEVTAAPDSAVAGVVRDDATGAPINRAEVGLLGGPFDQFTTTGLDGAFHFGAYSGTYTLTASALGYHPITMTGVVVTTGVTTTRTISLTGFPMGTLTGRVTQANTGLPLAATVSAASGYTTLETSSDPATGLYNLVAFSDTYTLTARAGGHAPATVAGITVTQGQTTTRDFVLQPQPCVLLVDDDGGRAYESYFRAALERVGVHYRPWEVDSQGGPTADDMAPYTGVLWFTGDDHAFDTLTAQDRANLTAYLNGGGGLFLTGTEIGVGNYATAFYPGVLYSQFVSDDSEAEGLTGGGIFAGLSFSITGGDGANNQDFPDALSPIAPAVRVFTYTNGLGGGVAVDTGAYRAINLGFGVEGVNNEADRTAILRDGLAWLGCPASPVQLQLGKTAIPGQVSPGDLLTYTLALTNNSTVSATRVVVTDALPAYTAFAWASDGGVLTDSVVAWEAPVVSPYGALSRTLVVTVTGAPAGTFLFPLVNAVYGARSDQTPAPAWGLPVTVTLLSSFSNHVYLPVILRN
jgi:uncharacterized repeat protein (TIGR01451 family)